MNRNEFFQALPITRLNLRMTGAALEICTDDIDDIHVMISGSKADAEAMRVLAKADTLTLEQPLFLKAAKAANTWLQVTIRLPRSWKGAVDARTITGWMNIRSFAGTDLALNTVSGTIMANDLNFMTISARSVTGDVKLTQVICKEVSLFSAFGSLSVMDVQLQKAKAYTGTGTVALTLPHPFEALTLASITGDLCVDAPIILCDAAMRSVSGRIRTTGVSIVEGGPKVRAATVSSDLDITTTLE